MTDPPYEIKAGSAFVRRGGSVIGNGSGGYNSSDCSGWVGMLGCVKPLANIAAFHKRGDAWVIPNATQWHRFYLVKKAPPPTPRPCFVSAVEECSIYAVNGKGKRQWFGNGYRPNYWLGMTPNRLNADYGHPSEKPLDAIETLVECLCPVGGLVLDPFAGSGTTGLACKNLGRKAVLIEIEEKYVKIAAKRLAQPVLVPCDNIPLCRKNEIGGFDL